MLPQRVGYVLVLATLAAGLVDLPVLAGFPKKAREHELEALREGIRVLEAETKLAASRQVYLLVDLPNQAIFIKGRGLVLYSLPIRSWSMTEPAFFDRIFRLRGRPAVVRPKVVPTAPSSSQLSLPDPINLRDMPAEYDLLFNPGLTIVVAPPFHERPWLRIRSYLREWWQRASTKGSRLRLTMSVGAAKSLAWVVTDGMPLLLAMPFSQTDGDLGPAKANTR